MIKNILLVLPLGGLLIGCVAPPSPGPGTCTALPVATCTGDKNDPLVEVDLDAMTISPECVNAKKGRVIIFQLDSASEITKGSVKVFAKEAENEFWLGGTNDPNKNHILVLAPKKNEEGANFPTGQYAYGIETDSWCIDPRVNVQN